MVICQVPEEGDDMLQKEMNDTNKPLNLSSNTLCINNTVTMIISSLRQAVPYLPMLIIETDLTIMC